MKFKLIVAALGLIAGAAHADIVPTTTIGGSDLLLDVWEQGASTGAPDQSFTLDLGITLTQFLNASNSSSTLATLLSTDSTWTSFLASSSSVAGDLQWSVIASGNKVPTVASYLASVTIGEDALAFGPNSANVNSANTQLSTTITNLNFSGAANVNEQVNTVASNAYYQTYQLSNFNSNAWDNGNNLGATGVQIAQESNVYKSATVIGKVLPGTLSFAQDANNNYVLSYNVAAVPEASGFGMLFAGFGALGFLGRRRKSA